MAAHDDVSHLEDGGGIFDGTGLGQVAGRCAVILRRGDEIADIAQGKKLAGLG